MIVISATEALERGYDGCFYTNSGKDPYTRIYCLVLII
jgi:hypothetical protein